MTTFSYNPKLIYWGSMSKRNLAIFFLVLVNAILFAFVFSYVAKGLVDSTQESYTARGIDAYLEEK